MRAGKKGRRAGGKPEGKGGGSEGGEIEKKRTG